MAFSASKMPSCPGMTCSYGISNNVAKSVQRNKFHCPSQGVELRQLNYGCLLTDKSNYSNDGLWRMYSKPVSLSVSQRSIVAHHSRGTHNTKEKGDIMTYGDCAENTSAQTREKDTHQVFPERTISSGRGLTEACKFVFNDAKFVNERARNDIILLSRGILRLDARVRQDVAILGSEFLKLDARAREDTEKIDRKVKKKAERLHHIARILKDKAESRLKSVADKHWSDGALEADLRRADIRAKQRAMHDALMALEFVKDIHEMMLNKTYNFPLQRVNGIQSENDKSGRIMLEKNGITLNFPPGVISSDQITAVQEAYWSMASALSEADGIDYTDPEELELLIAALIDLDAMDGKSSVSLLAECSSSPDVSTRRALANALAAAPSMWTLGNAGMGALQRLAEDSNPAIAAAATKAIYELKKQWEIEEGDSWRFTMNQYSMEEKGDDQEADNNSDTDYRI
ncbi:senescence-associated protein AAF, chlorolplastic [Argentina anserina]|uniref:senescence-associated protein AAF, chlorolplastic n=1 Tax=Argentina anserina TaxID=57926 RepID=UPI002176667A|nr:senescence-associated protein AAF, chlorolplastic [Potentilla anserina]XP_050374279.1 senescence-associated protein AAF, chlorolplastic [Potentilla anserina]XP_050374287.1 senescence-associated protein AAF, chlorolplastic [Potentilla anserina]